MSEINDGGPAFPSIKSEQGFPSGAIVRVYSEGGISLRDYFAAKALPACIVEFMTAGGAWSDYDDMAATVWNIADAMLRARGVKP